MSDLFQKALTAIMLQRKASTFDIFEEKKPKKKSKDRSKVKLARKQKNK